MTRARLAPVFALPFLIAADVTPERAASLQKAMATARQFLDVGMPAEAVATLEAEVDHANGEKAFLTLLREAYLAEIYRHQTAGVPNPTRIAELRRALALLGAPAPMVEVVRPSARPTSDTPVRAADPPLPPPSLDPVATEVTPEAAATAAFKKGDYATAARLFASAPSLTAEQKAAWAYCRIKVASECLNSPTCDAECAARCGADLTAALKLIPNHAELRAVGEQVLATATRKANGARSPGTPAAGSDPTGGEFIESDSFRVRHYGNRELAKAVARAADEQRLKIFTRWSGPPPGAWNPKCVITLHPDAAAYAQATGRPAGGTGHASVKLVDGLATERRIDLRADDPGVTANALPRELTHVVMADLFPDKPAPKWALEGMAVLAGTPDEVARYTRTLPRCARDGDWFALAQLLEMKDFPAEKITGFYCQSVSLVEYLIKSGGGEKNFTTFLRDCHRYGMPQALRRQYDIDGPQALEAAWKRAVLETGRAQGP